MLAARCLGLALGTVLFSLPDAEVEEFGAAYARRVAAELVRRFPGSPEAARLEPGNREYARKLESLESAELEARSAREGP